MTDGPRGRGSEVQTRDARAFLDELGVRAVVNGAGTYTALGGCLMLPEAVRAFEAMSRVYVRLNDLHDAAGARIASLLGCEAAMVTSGGFGGLMLGTAACVAGDSPEFIRRLPDTTGMKNEVIVLKSHRFPYDHAVRNGGVRLIEVESAAQLEQAIGPRTAMLLFLNKAEPQGPVAAAEFISIARARRVPTLNDAAADVPPADRLFRLTKLGFDLVAFSGGKGLRGPQSAGLLLGRADLIRAARLHTAPYSDTFGRGLKVSKEEIVAMLVAVEHYLARDHDADWREWEDRVHAICRHLDALAGVRTERFVPRVANEVPHARIRWDRGAIEIGADEAARLLRDGEPSIETVPAPLERDSIEVAAWTLEPGEAEIVARRIGEVLNGARRRKS